MDGVNYIFVTTNININTRANIEPSRKEVIGGDKKGGLRQQWREIFYLRECPWGDIARVPAVGGATPDKHHYNDTVVIVGEVISV